MLRRLDLQAGFGEVKNIPGKGAMHAKVLSGQGRWQRGKSGGQGPESGHHCALGGVAG